MTAFLIKRLLSAIITVWFIATATFFAMHAVPGDPLSQEKVLNENVRQQLQQRYGLDKPLLTQYARYMGNLLQGDLGVSFVQENRSVNDIIRHHFPVSAILGLAALLIALLGAVILGQVASQFKARWPDVSIRFTVVVFVSVPSFVLAAASQWLLLELNTLTGRQILPVAGWGSASHMWLPALILGLGTMAFLTRLMRSALLDVNRAAYLTTAQAKGLAPLYVFFHYRLRNAILPLLSVLGPAIAAITTGGFVVELIFAVPGLGRYFVQAVQQLDYTVIMGTTVFYGAFLVFMVTLVDIIYGLVDPRIRVASHD